LLSWFELNIQKKCLEGFLLKKLLLYLFIFTPAIIRAQVILTEVMFDPVGSESTDEFIEIYNAGSTAVDLSGFAIGDQTAREKLAFPTGMSILQPRQYAVVFDLDYFEQSGFYDMMIPDSALVLAVQDKTLGSGGLLNSRAETIVLLDASNDTVATYKYSPGNMPGHSDEKIDLLGDDSAENWGDSQKLHGTPGARNSISPLSFDLAIAMDSIIWAPEKPARRDVVNVSFVVSNIGIASNELERVQLFADLNNDDNLTEDELANEIPLNLMLAPAQKETIALNWQPAHSGIIAMRIAIVAGADLQQENNSAHFQIPVGYLQNDVAINEIMCAPRDEDGEWIEIVNISDEVVNLQGWMMTDEKSISKPIDGDFFLFPGKMFLLAMDSSVTQFQTNFVKINGWPTLNNDEDTIRLLDFNRTVVDSTRYFFPASAIPGTSLERINPRITDHSARNWGLSVAPAGSTPGRQNSIFTEEIPVQSKLFAHPNPFSPDADGRDDFTIISYELPMLQSQVSLTIYDLRGRVVRRVLNNAPSGANRQVVWDGKADDGRILEMGIYIIRLQAIDAGEGQLEEAKATIVLAKKM
jgi:hypothetical protein